MGERKAPAPKATAEQTLNPKHTGAYAELALSTIEADPEQPRRVFNADEIDRLATSLNTHGLLEPVVVYQVETDRYRLIAGERRLRAAHQLGWTQLPAVVRTAHPQSNLILALVENLQREDLSALEEAEAYQRLKDDHGLTQNRIATLVGKKRTTVANALRLLGLGGPARKALAEGLIDKGHARALLAIHDPATQEQAVTRCVKEGWSVRATEVFAKTHNGTPSESPGSTRGANKRKDASFHALSQAIGLEVNLSGRKITLTAPTRGDANLFLDRLTRMVRGAEITDTGMKG